MQGKGILVVISGFSGAGKGTLVKRLLCDCDDYALSVSMTTRGMREGEVDGRDYFFVTKDAFEDAIKNDMLVEHASYCGNYYGTPKAYVDKMLSEGKCVILEIEVQGAMQIKEKFPDTLLLFVTPPSIKILENRLRGRGTETEEVIAKRLRQAMDEAKLMEKYEYLIINDDLDECVKQTDEIIHAALFEASRNADFISDMKQQLAEINK
ncbi:MAG: guanylate kinase [Lachnospiraceae bacterium]|nr:guanylate kinase [Lachnospiraceae bacterium]